MEIAQPNKSALKLLLVGPPEPPLQTRPRILGTGIGQMRLPSWEEWKAMNAEIAREMDDVIPENASQA